MYSSQRGLYPTLSILAALFIDGYFILASLMYLSAYSVEHFADSYKVDPYLVYPQLLFVIIAMSIFPTWATFIAVSMFPKIRIDQDGISYKYFFIFGGKIVWQEIERVILYSKGFAVISINRPGLFIFNGLYFNKLHAMLVKHPYPVLLLSLGLSNFESIMMEIQNKSSALVVHR